ncbi:Essential protein Yae1, N terminal [Pichia californica]|uniref:Protein YAE1 n=1 Tax=Pichia californica TaxID=460514 RepID=A0A9P6WK66_9ASCO|nr:Essential protein Yae1, N terminal [[Candida] californica]KAG0688349.1 Essential protein Yae1, N terminal [[Candida] californica]
MSDCSLGNCSCKEKDKLKTNTSLHMESSLDNLSVNSGSDSDVWGSDSEYGNDDESTLIGSVKQNDFSRDVAALKRRHENRGYLDGLTKGSEIGLQSGFDNGYPLGAQLGGLIGELLAETIWRYSLAQINKDIRDQAFSELKINKVLSSEYFDSNLKLKNPKDHPIINKWTKYYEILGSPMVA